MTPAEFYSAAVAAVPSAVAWSTNICTVTMPDGSASTAWSCSAFSTLIGKDMVQIARGYATEPEAAIAEMIESLGAPKEPARKGKMKELL